MEFADRNLKCMDCNSDFVFTAGEQLFFYDKQFRNDPKRCKPCKAKRAGASRPSMGAAGTAASVMPLSRTETRTECSACGVDTTVPFKPTQGRPVLCRSCFQLKRVPSAVAAVATMDSPAERVALAAQALSAEFAAADAAQAQSAEATLGMIAQTPVEALADAAETPTDLKTIAASTDA